MVISKIYNLTLSKKANLRTDLEGWRGRAFTVDELKAFDVTAVLGTCCQLVVTHRESDGNTYANVTSVAGWPTGMQRPEPSSELLRYSSDEPNQLEQLPDWIKDKIKAQSSTAAPGPGDTPSPAPAPGAADFDDDIPF